ncbi:MAG: endonuclease/exonuclease/phosphatase family protein [Methylococcaceae bacterium]
MNEIQLLYVENVISRKKRVLQQTLCFFMQVENLSPDKTIDVIWAGEDGVWHTLPATWHSNLNHDKEYWRAETTVGFAADKSLPGNIEFALRYQTWGNEYWDNNHGLNYSSQADSGIKVVSTQPVLNIGFDTQLHDKQKFVLITAAVNQSVQAETVTVHWTTDNWKNTRQTPCHFKRNYWDETSGSNARNPNQYGTQLWKVLLNIDNAFKFQYTISCEGSDQVFWDNNQGNNFSLSHEPLKVMILNLHCYQEDNQDHKFSQIAKAINELDTDIVCLQEVAELWNDGNGDWNSNSANIINERLKHPFHLYTDWSHKGFDKYREGVAILSRYPLLKQDSRYVSNSHSADSIHSRKVVMAQVHIHYLGLINFFSAHLSWWDDGFSEQFNTLVNWAADNQTDDVTGTLLCGDFNITAGTEGYNLVVNGHEYEDQFLAINDHDAFEKIFKVNDPHWQDYLADDYRIDYIFMNKTSDLQITSGKVLFTEQDYGRVSDHCGYFMTFEPK